MPGKFYRYKFAEGDIVTLKKKHPCGNADWTVAGAGADMKLKCCGCGHIMTLGREALEKATVAVKPAEQS
ncbi:MAG: DUF951 domain-containing protein [Saccharofermentans sp.]|nr:DUF951 domain-containing protein [Saccharofermentans sp.]